MILKFLLFLLLFSFWLAWLGTELERERSKLGKVKEFRFGHGLTGPWGTSTAGMSEQERNKSEQTTRPSSVKIGDGAPNTWVHRRYLIFLPLQLPMFEMSGPPRHHQLCQCLLKDGDLYKIWLHLNLFKKQAYILLKPCFQRARAAALSTHFLLKNTSWAREMAQREKVFAVQKSLDFLALQHIKSSSVIQAFPPWDGRWRQENHL